MTEYRHSSGEVHDEREIRRLNPNTSFTSMGLTDSTLSFLNYERVVAVGSPLPSADTKIVVRDGVEQVDGVWKMKWKEQDRFADIEGGKTKAEQDAEHKEYVDNSQKDFLRRKRIELLSEADWQINKVEDAGGDTSAWRSYRQQLRDITNAADVYNVTWPTKPS